jgi:N-methylhydantoinase B
MRNPGETTYAKPPNPRPFAPAGTEVMFRTSGGGGWGDPLARDPEHVLRDVREGYVSAERAREAYGVVIDAGVLRVDEAATSALRAELRQGGKA